MNIDLTPLFRSTIGFDRMARLLDSAASSALSAYPPYNIEKISEQIYRIEMAVAGFRREDLNISTQEGILNISGKSTFDEDAKTYIYRGIARRAFERRFQLADAIRVTSAFIQDGMLYIELTREIPDHLKPQHIPISHGMLDEEKNNSNLLSSA